MTYGSLFTGIGGIDLGLERAGWQCKWQVEKDPYALAVLQRHWPDVARYRDVRYFLGSKRWRRVRAAWDVDLICGGFPCQDISNAGKRAGIEGARSGLWSEFARIIRLLRPRFVLVENVPALTIRGLSRVLGDLAALGYDAEWGCLPAAAVGAPHARWRIFLTAYRRQGPLDVRGTGFDAETMQREEIERSEPNGVDEVLTPDAMRGRWAERRTAEQTRQRRPHAVQLCSRDASNADSSRREVPQQICEGQSHADVAREGDTSDTASRWAGQRWRDAFAAHCESQGRLLWQNAEPGICGVAAGVPNRVHRLRCLGNAVIPQLAEWIGRRLADALCDETEGAG